MNDHDVVRYCRSRSCTANHPVHQQRSRAVGAGSSASSVTSRGPARGHPVGRRRRSRCSATSISISGRRRCRPARWSSTRSRRSGTSTCWCPTAPRSTSAGSRCSAARRSPSEQADHGRVRGRDPGAWFHPLREPQGVELVTVARRRWAPVAARSGVRWTPLPAYRRRPQARRSGRDRALVSATASVRAATPVAASSADHRGRLVDRHRGAGGAVAGGLHR